MKRWQLFREKDGVVLFEAATDRTVMIEAIRRGLCTIERHGCFITKNTIQIRQVDDATQALTARTH